MKKYTADELEEIVIKHVEWVADNDKGERADLSGTDLSYAALRGANLSGADLSLCDLSYVDFRRSDLTQTRLMGSDLRGADLRGAGLKGSDLMFADMWGAVGNMKEIKSIHCGEWPVAYTHEDMQIGCEYHSIKEWWALSDAAIDDMEPDALDWWRVWKPILQKIIEVSPADPP